MDKVVCRDKNGFWDLTNYLVSISKIYKLKKYGNRPDGGHKTDIKNKKYISFDKAIKL